MYNELRIVFATEAGVLEQGLIQVYTGGGKGKTTAALGLCVRACGSGLRVKFIQFLKGRETSERKAAPAIPRFEIERFGRDSFIRKGTLDPADIEEARRALDAARAAISSGVYDLVVLDEVNVAVFFELVGVDELLALLKSRPPHVEVVCTGVKAAPELIEAADLVTEMVAIKHPFEKGVSARRGIED